jgi:hypothetical protein
MALFDVRQGSHVAADPLDVDPPPADAPALVSYVIRGDSERALELACHLLKAGDIQVLEAAIVRLCARFGEGARLPHAFALSQWRAICADALTILQRSKWPVKDVVVLVAKLCILFRGAAPVAPRVPLTKLRTAVLEVFPEAATLTERGQTTFAAILPNGDAGERAFAERLLVGYLQLWAAPDAADVAVQTKLLQATDYLLRKKQLSLHLPQPNWPCPTIDEYDRGDMVWFLWGIWLIKYPAIEPMWRLYCRGYKRSARNDRIGLLMGARWLAATSGGVQAEQGTAAWSATELALFGQVEQYAIEMWRALSAAAEPERQARDNVWDLLPRTGGRGYREEANDADDDEAEHCEADIRASMKKVSISKKKAAGAMDPYDYLEPDMIVQDYERKGPRDAARPVHHRSGHRRYNVGEAWE